jgi:hypothetical protein
MIPPHSQDRESSIMSKYLAALLLTAAVLRANMEFSGFFLTSKNAYYTMTDTTARTTSGWLTTGQSFSGYTIVEFDREHDVLLVRHGAETLRLPLREGKVKAGRMTIVGTISMGQDQTISDVRATLFIGEEVAFPLKDGVTLHLKAELRPDGNLTYRSRFDVKEKDGTTKTLGSPTVVAVPGHAFSVKVGTLGYAFSP